MLLLLFQTGSYYCSQCFKMCLVNNVQEQVLRTGAEDTLAGKTFLNFRNSLKNSPAECLEQLWLIQQESSVCYGFHFLRFLLICQLESLDLTFTLKWFFLFERIFRTVLETRRPGCFQTKTAKNNFTRFFLDFWANISELFG